MTPQEAIKWIDGRMFELIHLIKIATSKAEKKRLNEEYQALTVLKSCAESRVPQRATYKPESDGFATTNYECLVCGCRRLGHAHLIAYCPDCGQALDWR